MPRLKILFVASECVPFAKTGGLGDVVGALPAALASRGHDVRVVLPRYRSAKAHAARKLDMALSVPLGGGARWGAVWEATLPSSAQGAGAVPVYLLDNDFLYDRSGIYGDAGGGYEDNLLRYAFLSRGALALARALDFVPDVVHVHDWQSALVPVYLDTLEAAGPLGRAASVLTIHNLGYQGWFDKHELPLTGLGWEVFHARSLEAYDRLNLLKGGLYHATLVSTVSPRYAQEIRAPAGGEGLDGVLRDRGGDVIGVLNGIDEAVWNPQTDLHLAARYSAEDLAGKATCKAALQRELGLPDRPDVPLLGIVSRLAHQKGIDVFASALAALADMDAQVVVLGSGEAWAEELFSNLSRTTDWFRAWIGMNEPLAHRIEAGADLFLMPSRYEPCGLNQLYSQRYGTLPVVRAVGGLDDTVEAFVTGYKFDELSGAALAQAVGWAVHTYRARPDYHRAMQRQAMSKAFGWSHAARQYEALYRMSVARRHGRI
jgi:starch synthase